MFGTLPSLPFSKRDYAYWRGRNPERIVYSASEAIRLARAERFAVDHDLACQWQEDEPVDGDCDCAHPDRNHAQWKGRRGAAYHSYQEPGVSITLVETDEWGEPVNYLDSLGGIAAREMDSRHWQHWHEADLIAQNIPALVSRYGLMGEPIPA